jgi:nucleoside-diphosphate-sugar epimerase
MMAGHLVSGATGFVGGALAVELLDRVDGPVACVVRDTGTDPRTRLMQSLRTAAAAYGRSPQLVEMNADRLHVVIADLAGDVAEVARPSFAIDEVWHSAASLKFLDRDRDEIFQANVHGTRNVLQMAERWGAKTFNYISTAYVAGRRCGHIPEALHSGDGETNNLYELSKVEAEGLVREAAERLRVRIFRPSIVVGHSQTYAATTFSGLYGFMRQLLQLRKESERRLGGYLSRKPLQIVAEPEMPLNLIPVDHVVGRAVQIALAGDEAEVVHLTNASAPPLGRVLDPLFERYGLHKPNYVTDKARFSVIDGEFDREMNFYGSYLSGTKHFAQSSTRTLLAHEFSDETLLDYFEWYLTRLGVADHLTPRQPV